MKEVPWSGPAPVALVKVWQNRVWIESDVLGARHVMVQSEKPGSEPFRYASFFYDYTYTNNHRTLEAAKRVAETLAQGWPCDVRYHEDAVPTETTGE